MQIETVAVLMLGGAWDQDELGDNDIAPCSDVIEAMQQRLIKGYQDVHIELVDRAHVDRVTAERDALQQLLNARDKEIDRLSMIERRFNWLLNDCKDADITAGIGWLSQDFDTIEQAIDSLMENQA